jgi:hypothetical protein
MPKAKRIQDTARTSRGLRNTLFEQIDLLRRGQINAKDARAFSSLASQILSTAKLELNMARFLTLEDTEPQEKNKLQSIDF